MWKARLKRGSHLLIIAVLSGCTAIHPETIAQKLTPEKQETFQRDFAECQAFAETKRPEFPWKTYGFALSVAGIFTAVGVMIEYKQRWEWDPPITDHSAQHGGNALLGFSLAGLAVASGIVINDMISRQNSEDEDVRGCLYRRGYPVFD